MDLMGARRCQVVCLPRFRSIENHCKVSASKFYQLACSSSASATDWNSTYTHMVDCWLPTGSTWYLTMLHELTFPLLEIDGCGIADAGCWYPIPTTAWIKQNLERLIWAKYQINTTSLASLSPVGKALVHSTDSTHELWNFDEVYLGFRRLRI